MGTTIESSWENERLKDEIQSLREQLAGANARIEAMGETVLNQQKQIVMLRDALDRIVHYYTLASTGSSLLSLTAQAKAEHENTMFGAARAAIAAARKEK